MLVGLSIAHRRTYCSITKEQCCITIAARLQPRRTADVARVEIKSNAESPINNDDIDCLKFASAFQS
jgi:hypothetical protein